MRRSWAIAGLALVLGACGAEEPNRFDLRTPGANTGAPIAATPSATETSEKRKPVTAAEKRVIKGWSDSLRKGRVKDAVRYFSVPAYVSGKNTPDFQPLPDRAAVEAFNRGLTCGSKLLRTRRGADDFVVGIFRLTERATAGKPGCGPLIDTTTAVAFEIKDDHIVRWVALELSAVDPDATPTPTADAKTG